MTVSTPSEAGDVPPIEAAPGQKYLGTSVPFGYSARAIRVDGAGFISIPQTAKDAQAAIVALDAALQNGGAPSGGAGGVLSGNYPNPGFANDMALQSELDGAVANLQSDIDGKAATGHLHDATDIATGTLDLARIPILPSSRQIVSAGDLTALTSGQKSAVGSGTIVTVVDGRRFAYSGSGDKTLESSYVVLADITPAWEAVEGKPVEFPPSAHPHSADDITTGVLDAARLPTATTTVKGAVQLAANGNATAGRAPAADDVRFNINTQTSKTDVVDADELTLWDSVSSAVRKITFANIAKQFVKRSLVTNKGDLIVGTGASTLARLAAGADGQAIVYDSTTATGLKAAAMAGGGGGVSVTVGNRIAFPFDPMPIQGQLTTVAIPSAGAVMFYRVTLGETISFNSLVVGLATQSASDTAAFGFYSSDGNTRLCSSGAVPTGSGGANGKILTLGSTFTLTPGRYIYAWTASAITPKFFGYGMSSYSQILGTGEYLGIATNAAVAGDLPPTLGALGHAGGSYQLPQIILQAV